MSLDAKMEDQVKQFELLNAKSADDTPAPQTPEQTVELFDLLTAKDDAEGTQAKQNPQAARDTQSDVVWDELPEHPPWAATVSQDYWKIAAAVLLVCVLLGAQSQMSALKTEAVSLRHSLREYRTSGVLYFGEWKDSKKHGQGEVTYKDGGTYEGEWKDGKMHGQGKETWTNGRTYEGEWKDGKPHGQGKDTTASGETYDGEWKDGKIHGQGTYTWADGRTYEGEWKDDKRHGQGKDTYLDGRIAYEGEYKDGESHGQGKMTHADGSIQEGRWEENRFIG